MPLAVPLIALSRRDLTHAPARPLHTPRNATKAYVSLVECAPATSEAVVVKDFAARSLAFRVLFARPLLSREWKALSFLNGCEGVPAPVARLDADAFAMSLCAGASLRFLSPGEVTASAVQELERLVSELHARGVTHGDLHRDNILLDDAGRISVLDWATSCVFGPNPRGLKAWTWRQWQELDLRALAKIKARYAPELLRHDEQARLTRGGSSIERAVRGVGALWKKRRFALAWPTTAFSLRATARKRL